MSTTTNPNTPSLLRTPWLLRIVSIEADIHRALSSGYEMHRVLDDIHWRLLNGEEITLKLGDEFSLRIESALSTANGG